MTRYYSDNEIKIFYMSWLRSIHELQDSLSDEELHTDELINHISDTLADFVQNAQPNDIVSILTMSLFTNYSFSSRVGMSTAELDDAIFTPVLMNFFEDIE